MQRDDHHRNHVASLLSSCIKAKNLKFGRTLHSHLIKTALYVDTFLSNRLIQMYSQCNSIDCARKSFDDVPSKNTHSWNTLISAYCQMANLKRARQLFDEMPEPNVVACNSILWAFLRGGFCEEAMNFAKGMHRYSDEHGIFLDEVSVVGLVKACAGLNALELLREVHGLSIVTCLDSHIVVCNSLIDAYGKCFVPESSWRVFSRMKEKDAVSWTSIIVAYSAAGKMEEACSLFNHTTLTDEVSWTALINGLVKNGECEKAISFFVKMLSEGVRVNDVTYVSILSACAELALIGKGKQIHGHKIRVTSTSIFDNVFVINALIDMYSKCGDMISSMRLFERLDNKDRVSWNSIITGFAQNGHGEASLAIFHEMIRANVKPDHVTFVAVLSACSHSGLVSEGIQFLNIMQSEFHLTPRQEHYAILVDLLGRKNRLEEAFELMKAAPCGSNRVSMWGALLATCRVHGNLELATTAAEALFELEPENTGRYVMLSNVYATAGKWDDVGKIRSVVADMGLKKEAGCSWIELNDVRYIFVAEDIFKSEFEVVDKMLLCLVKHMKDVGHGNVESMNFLGDYMEPKL